MFIGGKVMMKTLLIGFVVAISLTTLQAQYAEPINHGGLYIGPRIGWPLLLGMRARYVADDDEKPRFYVDADATTSGWVNALSIGGGLYPLGSTLYVGAKYHTVSTPLIDDPRATVNLYSVEIGAAVALSSTKSWMLMVDAGPLANQIFLQPNLTCTIVARLF